MTAPPPSLGRACGKVILLGEHFVVHGAPALAVPLTARQVELRLGRAPGAWDVPEAARPALSEMLRHEGVDPQAVTLALSTTLPLGAGLGGSAALAVALVRALGEDDPARVNARAHALERLAHGTPSGIDDTVVTWQRPVWFQRGQAPEPFEAPLPPLWLAVVPREGTTRQAVASVARFAQASPDRFAQLAARAARLAHDGRRALLAADFAALGAAMADNQALLAEIGVSSPALDRLIAAATAAGAACKLTGAGLGGAVVALAPPEVDLQPVFEAAGAREVIRP